MNGKNITAAAMDKFLEEEMKSINIPGLSITIINGGKVVYNRNLGYANLEKDIKVTNKTLFEAASISKPVFAYYVMKLVDKGMIALDTPLYKYMPYEDIAYDERYKLITARMVLTHSTGFPNWRNDNVPESVKLPRPGALFLKFTPGTDVSYSGEGFQYLAKVIAHLFKTDLVGLGAYLYKDLCMPLGMKKSTWLWNEYVEQHRAIGYHLINDSNKVGYYQMFKEVVAPASLRSNSLEFSKFLIHLMNGTGLTKESINEMLKVQRSVPSADWGLGIAINKTDFGQQYSHGGSNGNFQSYMMMNKEQKAGFVIFVNNDKLDALNMKLEPYFSNGVVPEERKSILLPQHILDQYVGEYQLSPEKKITIISSGGKTFLQPEGDAEKYECYASSETDFFFKSFPLEIHFIKDENGKVIGFDLDFGAGKLEQYKKVK